MMTILKLLVKVISKIIPLSKTLKKYLQNYIQHIRSKQQPNKENVDIVFLIEEINKCQE